MNFSIEAQKNKILNIAIVILALVAAFNIYKRQDRLIESLRETKATEMSKNNLLGDIAFLEKRIDAYRKFLNQKDSSSLMKSVSELAERYGVKLVSIKPQPESSAGIYNKLPFRLAIDAKGYHQIGKFISALESSPYIFIIEGFSLAPAEGGSGVKAELNLYSVFYNALSTK